MDSHELAVPVHCRLWLGQPVEQSVGNTLSLYVTVT